jgi:nucleotide-binding universal stress UspA family protein
VKVAACDGIFDLRRIVVEKIVVPRRDVPSAAPRKADPRTITRVLAALDGQAFGERVLPAATSLASALGVGLELIRVTWHQPPDAERGYLAAVAERLTDIAVTTRVEEGLPGPVLSQIAPNDEVLLCLATHGHSGATAVALGGVADEVLLRGGSRPVLVGPAVDLGASPEIQGSRVVLCFDGSDHARSVVPTAVDLASRLDLGIRVVMVLHRDGEFLGDHDSKEPKRHAEALVQELTDAGCPAELVLLDGLEPARAIARYASQLPASLIVTASHGSSGLLRGVIGSTAMRVVHHAPCPVVVRRPSDAASATRQPGGTS